VVCCVLFVVCCVLCCLFKEVHVMQSYVCFETNKFTESEEGYRNWSSYYPICELIISAAVFTQPSYFLIRIKSFNDQGSMMRCELMRVKKYWDAKVVKKSVHHEPVCAPNMVSFCRLWVWACSFKRYSSYCPEHFFPSKSNIHSRQEH